MMTDDPGFWRTERAESVRGGSFRREIRGSRPTSRSLVLGEKMGESSDLALHFRPKRPWSLLCREG